MKNKLSEGLAMAKKKISTAEQYEFVYIAISDFSAQVNASVNYEARMPRHQHDELRVYSFGSTLMVSGLCTYPEEREGHQYQITIYGREPGEGDLQAKLADYHVRDKNGMPKYRKSRGREVPVYDAPNGLGLLEKQRGLNFWNGWLWVPESTVAQMFTLVTSKQPVYIDIHERRIGRTPWINGFCLQTTDPSEE